MKHAEALAGLRVLIVEDEMLVSLIIEDTLADEDCVIVGPFDEIAGALAAARSELIDVAVLDVNIGGVKIYPVAEVLTQRGIPFLLLSGYGKNAVPDNRPDWPVCSKPFKPNELVSQLVEQVAARARRAGN